MTLRRVIAANRDGRSAVISDDAGITNAFSSVPGFNPIVAWKTAHGDIGEEGYALGSTCIPGPGGTTLFFVTFPPDASMGTPDFDPAAAGAEYLARIPGLAESFEPENPGVHTTPTVDYAIVQEGEIWCEFDDGETHLQRGDLLVNCGTRHAWRNRSDQPATMIFVLIGQTA